jgi:copper transport protein
VRGLACLAALWILIAQSLPAFGHATLTSSQPADGAVLSEPPGVATLSFDEPVSPLVIRLVGPNGEAIAPVAVAENATVSITLPPLRSGTHALSWRVVSADGHPVAGTLVFSVGEQSANLPPLLPQAEAGVRPSLWAAKVIIYAGLFIGIGGAFFQAWLANPALRLKGHGETAREQRSRRLILFWVLGLALAAVPVSVGLQGLDALGLPLAGLLQGIAWQTGFGTAYGRTAIAVALALAAGILALVVASRFIARILALSGVLAGAVALTLSGHAGTVEPRWLTQSAVLLHGLCVALWIGALFPLLRAIRQPDRGRQALTRFSRLIPYAVAALAISGATLATVQLGSLENLWASNYGIVLAAKLALVLALLGFAAANRFSLVPQFEKGGRAAVQPFARSIRFEIGLAIGILAIVGLWRFTPPPRMPVGPQVSVHMHSPRAMAQVDMAPSRTGGARVDIFVSDGDLNPITAQEVTLILANEAAGIEPMRRSATSAGDSLWRIDDLRIPVAGRWKLRIDILINDFEKATIEEQTQLPRMP